MSEDNSKNINGVLWFNLLKKHQNIIVRYIHPNIILETRKEESILKAMEDIINYLLDVKNNIENK